jgi:hypothetical protein
MDVYGHRQGVPPPTTSSRRQHQRYSIADYASHHVAAQQIDMRSHVGTTRFSLPSPGSRSSPQSLPPPYGRRQAAPPSTAPHYVTPTRSRQVPPGAAHPRTVLANSEQWESLRSKGYVLKGTGDAPRTSVAFAPALAVIPVSPYVRVSSPIPVLTDVPTCVGDRVRSLPRAVHMPVPNPARTGVFLHPPSKSIPVLEQAIIQAPQPVNPGHEINS